MSGSDNESSSGSSLGVAVEQSSQSKAVQGNFAIKNLDTGEEFNVVEEESRLNALLGHLTVQGVSTLDPSSDVESTGEAILSSPVGSGDSPSGRLQTGKRGRALIKYLKHAVKNQETPTKSPDASTASGSDPKSVLNNNVVRVSSSKKERTKQCLNDLKFVQCVRGHQGAIWASKFSQNGMFLATAGKDTKVMVWRVSTQAEARSMPPSQVNNYSCAVQDYKPQHRAILAPTPLRVYSGHTLDVVALAWSGSNFLASGATDCTVRIWHISKKECLVILKHNDIVTCVEFHPMDDGILITGSFDKKLRTWNIPSARVIHWHTTPYMITALAFMAKGQMVVTGFINGQCIFFHYDKGEGFQFNTEIDCRNRRVSHRKGKKVSGIRVVEGTSAGGKSDKPKEYVLVTTNDSRIRLFETEGFACIYKFKGLVNNNLQIVADSKGGKVLCSSEDKNVFLWQFDLTKKPTNLLKKHNTSITTKCHAYESFAAHNTIVTSARFFPDTAIDVVLGPFADRAARNVLLTCGGDGHIHVFAKED